jgi:hypothetical protein
MIVPGKVNPFQTDELNPRVANGCCFVRAYPRQAALLQTVPSESGRTITVQSPIIAPAVVAIASLAKYC